MPGMYGADVAQLRLLATQFDRAADQLDSCRTAVGGAVRTSPWQGPDAARFRGDWDGGHAGRVAAAASTLRAGAQHLRTNADQQEQASAVDGGGSGPGTGGPSGGSGGGGLFGWVGDAWNWVGDRAEDAWDWAGDRVEDAWSSIVDRADSIRDEFGNLLDAGGQLWDATGGSLLSGRWPRTTEVVASLLRLQGAGLSAGVAGLTLGGVELNLFDDGEPYAGAPQPAGGLITAPADLASLTASVTDAYNAGDGVVRVTTVDTPDGPRVIVSIPGTENWNPLAGDNPMDLTGNLVTAGGGRSTMTEAVELAMANANIPPDAQVLLIGHSQGGMTVADLASDADFVSKYNVTNAVTFGSPVDSDHFDPRVNVLEMQHFGDVVPMLDMGDALYVPSPSPFVPNPGNLLPGSPILPGIPSGYVQGGPNHTTVTLPPPGFDPVTNHSHQNYTSSVAGSSNPSLLAYEQQLRDSGFLGGTSGNTTAVDVEIGRKN